MDNFDLLFQKYLDRTCTRQEAEQLFVYFREEKNDHQMAGRIATEFDLQPLPLSDVDELAIARNRKRIATLTTPPTRLPIWKRPYLTAAIAASVLLALTIYLIIGYLNKGDMFGKGYAEINVRPGDSTAVLTLADGRRIALDKVQSGELSNLAGMRITKDSHGQIIYDIGAGKTITAGSNTLATPRGGTYQVRLPDGTRVWLNAASTLTYPLNLSRSDKRSVTLEGEAYFEVAKDAARPFIVTTPAQQVKVLGTHFNINSYGDNGSTLTTLSEGSVEVSVGPTSKILKPGQQASVTASSVALRKADMEVAMAWKNGQLLFRSATLEEIMKQVQRWYNIDVVYQGQVRHRVFTGGISRSSNLSTLLDIIRESGISFELEQRPQGRTLIISE